jgi:hypothetical protein
MDDFVRDNDRWPRWLAPVLILVHGVAIAIFAYPYFNVVAHLSEKASASIFVAASVVWFAFCGLFSGILAKVTVEVVAEMRLSASRLYVRRLIDVFSKIGVARETLVRIGEHSVQMEFSRTGKTGNEILIPGTQVLNAIKDAVELITKSKG